MANVTNDYYRFMNEQLEVVLQNPKYSVLLGEPNEASGRLLMLKMQLGAMYQIQKETFPLARAIDKRDGAETRKAIRQFMDDPYLCSARFEYNVKMKQLFALAQYYQSLNQ